MSELKAELTIKAKDLLIWLNQALPVPGRIRLMVGNGKSIVVVFSDSTSVSLEDAVNNRKPEDVEKIIDTKDPNIMRLEKNSRHQIEYVFMILTMISKICEKYFHDPMALLKVLDAVSQLEIELSKKEK